MNPPPLWGCDINEHESPTLTRGAILLRRFAAWDTSPHALAYPSKRIYEGRAPGNGATLVTAGDVVFWGDLNQKFRAFDADTGKILWEATLGGPIQNSTITYRVNGKQHVAVVTGLGSITANLFSQAGISPQRNNAIHAFALPN